jgi:Zn-dependent protease with chaperone function
MDERWRATALFRIKGEQKLAMPVLGLASVAMNDTDTDDGVAGFQGGVFHASLASGRAGARIAVRAGQLQATTEAGEQFTIAAHDLELELGGASGKMWLCRDRLQDLTIFSEAAPMTASLRTLGSGAVRQVDEQLARRSSGARRSFGWGVVILSLLLVTLWMLPVGLRWAAASTAEQLPTSVDVQLGQVGWSSMSAQMVLLDDEHLASQAVQTMVDRLQPHDGTSEEAPWRYHIYVADDPMTNAFALPGGWIVIMRGLIEEAETADEVAAVVAHEMGHVIHRHGLKRVAHSLGLIAGLQLLIGDLGGLAATASQFATLAVVNDYSRDAEREADQTGIEIMHRAGADPYALANFFERLAEKNEAMPEYLAWLSTHPSHQERIDAVSAYVAELPPTEPVAWDIDWQAVHDSLVSRSKKVRKTTEISDGPTSEPSPDAHDTAQSTEGVLKNED